MDDTQERAFRSALIASSRETDVCTIAHALHDDGFAVLERPLGPAAFELARTREFDVVIWEARPGPNAGEVFERLHLAKVPVIALAGEGGPALMGSCLEAGADACLAPGADGVLVVAQVHAVLRRWEGTSRDGFVNGRLQLGDIGIDSDRCEVECRGRFVPLTATEFRIVEYMARQGGKTLAPHEVLNAISSDYHYHAREAQDVFKVYARRIRRKLEPSEDEPRYLVTIRGFGYRLEGGQALPGAARERGAG